MATFAQATKERRAPGRTLVLEPWAFADEWASKPKAPVCVGIRLMSEADKSKARAEAERLADELHPKRGLNWIDAFNDALMRQVAALGLCDPNDVSKPTEILKFAEEQVRIALTSSGTRFIFDAIDRFELEVSPISPEVTDAEIEELSALLANTPAAAMQPGIRRLAHVVLEELRALAED